MSKVTTMKVVMYENVLTTLREKQSLLENSPALNAAFIKLETETTRLRQLIQAFSTDAKWISNERRRKTDEMLTLAFRINKVLVAYAYSTNNVSLMDQFSIKYMDFMRGGFEAKRIRVNGLIEVLPEFLPALSSFNVSQEDFEELLALYNDAVQLSTSPRNARVNKTANRIAIENAIQKIDRILNLEIHALMLILEGIDPDAFIKYKSAKKLVHAPTKHRKPEADGSDQDDGDEV